MSPQRDHLSVTSEQRAITPRGQHGGPLNVLWMRGAHRNYRDYPTAITA